MKVIISIKPEYAYKIFDGIKRVEFRKRIFKNDMIKTVVVYASSPIQKIIGEFEIDDILSLSPQNLWEVTKEVSGITEDFFFEYFRSKDIAYGIRIKKLKRYDTPLCIKKHFKMTPPQSYAYIR